MNVHNMLSAIEVMQRADHFYIGWWQEQGIKGIADTEDELHRCGTAACFAGWVGVTKEFRADGGTVCSVSGIPRITTPDGVVLDGAAAMAYWLDIPIMDADALCWTGADAWHFYGCKDEEDISSDDVACALLDLMLKHNGDDRYVFDKRMIPSLSEYPEES